MRLLLKVIKPSSTVSSNEVVMISDLVLKNSVAGENGQLPDERDSEQLGTEGEFEGDTSLHPVLSAQEVALNRAKEMAEALSAKILHSAHNEREEILEQAHEEAVHLRDKAVQEGYHSAYQEMRDQIEENIVLVHSTLDDLQQKQELFIQQYEENLCFLSIDIAEKVLNKKIEQDDNEIIELVKQAVLSVKNADWISVEVSDKLQGLIEKLAVVFADQAEEKHIDLSTIDAPVGTCVVHTDEAVIDASVSAQMQNARELFEKM